MARGDVGLLGEESGFVDPLDFTKAGAEEGPFQQDEIVEELVFAALVEKVVDEVDDGGALLDAKAWETAPAIGEEVVEAMFEVGEADLGEVRGAQIADAIRGEAAVDFRAEGEALGEGEVFDDVLAEGDGESGVGKGKALGQVYLEVGMVPTWETAASAAEMPLQVGRREGGFSVTMGHGVRMAESGEGANPYLEVEGCGGK